MKKKQIALLKQLEEVLDAKHRQSANKLSQVRRKQEDVKGAISTLTAQTSALGGNASDGMAAIGADVAWNVWSGRQKTKLNREMAFLRVEEEAIAVKSRRDFGKRLACSETISSGMRSSQKRDSDSMINSALEYSAWASVSKKRLEK